MKDNIFWLEKFKEIGNIAMNVANALYGKKSSSFVVGRGAGGDRTYRIDKELEKVVINELKKICNVRLISEEVGIIDFGKPKAYIIADPLDGSHNAKEGIPYFSISLAFSTSEKISDVEVGFVKNLINGEEYYALKGRGAFFNGKKIHTTKNEMIKTIAVEFHPNTRYALNKSFGIMDNAERIRCMGSIALDLCLLAKSTFDAVLDLRGKNCRLVDISAGKIIVEEAGGVVSDEYGRKIDNYKIEPNKRINLVAAGNEKILNAILSLMEKIGFCIWVTGLPGSGKTKTANSLYKKLEEKGYKLQILRLDDFRKTLAPERKYDSQEREKVYNTTILMAKFLTDNGINVIIDATGHKRKWRNIARKLIKNFKEVYIDCPIEICIIRETKRKNKNLMKGMYKKALERLRKGKKIIGLGEVIGVDVPFERGNEDLCIKTTKLKPEECAMRIIEKFNL